MVLETARNENDCNEVVFAYSLDGIELRDRDGEYLAVAFGDEHSVSLESDTDIFHLLRTTKDCVLVLIHNHPNLSKISLQDISYLLKYETIKMIVVVTNIGSINYVVKSGKYNWDKTAEMFEKAGRELPYLIVKSSDAHKIHRTGTRSSGRSSGQAAVLNRYSVCPLALQPVSF